MFFLKQLNRFIWGIPTLLCVLLIGIQMSRSSSFAQFYFFPQAVKNLRKTITKPQNTKGISTFQAFCTALGATVGTGNLAGVAGALALGGPGAIFWMWITGLLGMATKYSEALLGNAFRYSCKDGESSGGTMYLLEKLFPKKGRIFGITYGTLIILASFGVGNTAQVNTVATGIGSIFEFLGFHFDKSARIITGLAISGFVFFLLSGGVKQIVSIVEFLVPLAASAYVFICFTILVLKFSYIPEALGRIFLGAFHPRAITGGTISSIFLTMRVGVTRGIFTNEAGMGTAAMAHAGVEDGHPVDHGLMGMMEVFIDTILICSLTALVILVSGIQIPYGEDFGMRLTIEAFSLILGKWATIFLTIEVCLFGIATILGWSIYGARCCQYVFRNHNWLLYAALQGVVAFVGALGEISLVWLFSELINGFLLFANLPVLLKGQTHISRLTKDYKDRKAAEYSANGGIYENFHQRKSL